MSLSASLKPLVTAALLAAAPAFAVDGVLLINQSRALDGNVTPGDAPGFPVTISRPGSYRLASNLSVPDGNATAIEIGADHVTLDLNGFAILGPVNCSGGFPCPGAGVGFGVRTGQASPRFNVTVRNGTVQGMGAGAVFLLGDSNLVEHVSARSNGDVGIQLFPSNDRGASTVRHSRAQRNGFGGINVQYGRADSNTASGNGNYGIFVGHGTASNNIADRNRGYGLTVSRGNYFGNSLDANQWGGVSGAGAVNHGQNSCDGASCPGAQF